MRISTSSMCERYYLEEDKTDNLLCRCFSYIALGNSGNGSFDHTYWCFEECSLKMNQQIGLAQWTITVSLVFRSSLLHNCICLELTRELKSN